MSILLTLDEIKQMYRIESTVELCRRLQDGTIPQPIARLGPPTWDPEEVARAVAKERPPEKGE